MPKWAGILARASWILVSATGCSTPKDGRGLQALGMDYQLQERKEPRPNRVHVLRVDLAKGKLQPAVVLAPDPDGEGPAEAALTNPFQLVCTEPVLALINTNPWDSFPDSNGQKNRSWFEGQAVDIHGLAVSGRQSRSSPGLGGASVWVDQRRRVFLGDAPGDHAVVEGMAGFQPILREGAVVVAPGGPQHPRTAIGVDRSGRVLWLVVVDGRQAQFSEGMTLEELGGVMRDLGCWHATNMDGGGSSVMGLMGKDGYLRMVNRPSDRDAAGLPKVRPVPMILTIQKRPVRWFWPFSRVD